MKITKIKPSNYLYKNNNFNGGYCNLCLSRDIYNGYCVSCGNKDITLYYTERIINIHKHTLNMDFSLSKDQQNASNFFLEHLKIKRNAFLNAVCGSGKTEIMYESILHALNEGMKVIITIPRKEIVRELSLRLKKVFKDTTIHYLDQDNHNDKADLLISTVNQLINYEKEFDLIIMDEVDAYPFSDNDFLHRLVEKSLKDDGVIFYMSATRKEKLNYDTYTLKRRYHNENLSMPIFIKENDKYVLKNPTFMKVLNNKDRKHIIFVPSIKIGESLEETLGIKFVSSQTKNLNKIIDDFKNDKYNNLISTTILERGITIPYTDVIILYASNEVFDQNTIIQICGRVGRKSYDPHGSIYIFYENNSLKFLSVKKYIKRMNKR